MMKYFNTWYWATLTITLLTGKAAGGDIVASGNRKSIVVSNTTLNLTDAANKDYT